MRKNNTKSDTLNCNLSGQMTKYACGRKIRKTNGWLALGVVLWGFPIARYILWTPPPPTPPRITYDERSFMSLTHVYACATSYYIYISQRHTISHFLHASEASIYTHTCDVWFGRNWGCGWLCVYHYYGLST